MEERKAFSEFSTELQVRPDDIDMHRHVHASRYQDYVLAARFEQMERCYGMSMAAFQEKGLSWFVSTVHIEYKRPLGIAEKFLVKTWVQEMGSQTCNVGFRILKENGKVSAEGYSLYTLVALATGKAEPLPEEVRARYSI